MRGTIVGAVVVASLCCFLTLARADDEVAPSGTIELKGGSVAVGVGFSWASGTLTYKGNEYPITADGFDVGDIGVTNVSASGKVYNLTNLVDFDGSYSGFTAGAALVAGGSTVSMQNENGVRIELVSGTQGVKITLSAGNVNLKIKK